MAVALGKKSIGSIVKLNVSGIPTNFIVANQEVDRVAVIIQDIWRKSRWSTATSSDCTDFFNSLDAEIKPHVIGGKAFLPTSSQANGGWSYFNSDSRRIAKYNGSASTWWLADLFNNDFPYFVGSDGSVDWFNYSLNTRGVRPALYLPPDLLVDDNDMIVCGKESPAEKDTVALTLTRKEAEQLALYLKVNQAERESEADFWRVIAQEKKEDGSPWHSIDASIYMFWDEMSKDMDGILKKLIAL